MKRGNRILLSAGLVAASMALGGCGEEEQEYDQVCLEEATMIRYEDERCEKGHHGHAWFYIPFIRGGTLPAHPIGSKVTTSGSFTRPATGSFSRGGFGGYRGGSTGGG